MNSETPKHGGAGSGTPIFQTWNGAVVCCDAAEARLLRKVGAVCITSTKLRVQLDRLLTTGGDTAVSVAVAAVGRLGGVSTADDPANWPLWAHMQEMNIDCAPLRRALESLPAVETPFKDPENLHELEDGGLWTCTGTTVLVALNTSELVRAADTYAKSNCYRHHGRMDEPFIPQAGKVCLISVDELRLLRIEGIDDIEIVFTYDPQETAGMVAAPHSSNWPASLRALCAERPGLRVGVAPALVAPRYGEPFFLGLSRGVGYEALAITDPFSRAARRYCAETNIRTVPIAYRVVVWAGGDDVRELVRYGGLSIFLDDRDSRRKVQLRSLGLIRSGTLAGAAIYDMADNRAILEAWAARRDFLRRRVSSRDHDRQRVRRKALHESHQGDIRENTVPLMGFMKRSKTKRRVDAIRLRNILIGEIKKEGCAVAVSLMNLREGGIYHLNARMTTSKKTGETALNQKRCNIRCPRWEPENSAGMLEWLAKEKCVAAAGIEPSGAVFAVVRVANGTEDQQAAAVNNWAQEAGMRFPHRTGARSWLRGSVAQGSVTHIGTIHFTNWKALSLETACFERYQTQGEYGKPLKLARRGAASASERARAYVDKVPLDEEHTRNKNLHSVSWNVGDKFGLSALLEVAPLLLARSTLPEKEKRTIVDRAITRTERKQSHV